MKTSLKSYTIPMDVFIDIMRILLSNKIRNQIEAVNEVQNSLILRIEIVQADNVHQKVIQEIEEVLTYYGYYINGKPNIQCNL